MQINMFGHENQLKRLSALGDSLEKISKVIDFEYFRPMLEEALSYKSNKGKGGRPPYDVVMMFKIVMLQQWNGNLADDRTEFLINDRLSFQRFLGLELGEKSPDSKTIWLFKEGLKKANALDDLFEMFNKLLVGCGIISHKGIIQDATFVDVPKQRNTRYENEQIKRGEIPIGWEGTEDSDAHKLSQKDTDARWAKKGNETHFGYKNHITMDKESKIITNSEVTPANVHDSQAFVLTVVSMLFALDVFCGIEITIWADSAYNGTLFQETILFYFPNIKFKICQKGSKNHPLTDEQKTSNTEKSRVRSRVEHVFGAMTNDMGGIIARSIGIMRVRRDIIAKNLAYNLKRAAYLLSAKNMSLAS
jgi:IS5 family transposase